MALLRAYQLLHGPYHPPNLAVGDVATCLLRKCAVRILDWTLARISWPRCHAIGQRGGSGLLLAGDLVRALERESAIAIRYWWGVSEGPVWRWRRVLGIGRLDTEGSHCLHRLNSQAGAEVVKRMKFTSAKRKRQRGTWWTMEELALLGTMPDKDLALRLGKTTVAVTVKRNQLGIPVFR